MNMNAEEIGEDIPDEYGTCIYRIVQGSPPQLRQDIRKPRRLPWQFYGIAKAFPFPCGG